MKKNLFFMIVLSFVFIFAGCGNEGVNNENSNESDNAKNQETTENDENAVESAGKLVVTDLEGNTVEFDEPPTKIVPLSAGDLETIYALDGEAVGRPVIRGDVPEYYKDVPEIGTTNDVNIEKIVSLEPDLVIAHPQLNADVVPLLEELDIPVLFTGAETIEEIQLSIEMFGKVLQNEEKAEELVAEIDEKKAFYKESNENNVRTLIVFGVPGNWMVALPDSLSGNMLEVVGGYNVAKDFPKLERFPQYAQLEVEKIVEADPEVVFLISPGPSEVVAQSFTSEMEKNPAWNSVSAVENENIIYLPNNLFGASPGSKVVQSLDYLHEQIQGIVNVGN